MPTPPAAPSFVEPSVIASVDDPRLRTLKLDDLQLITNGERWAHAHYADKVCQLLQQEFSDECHAC